MSKPYSIENLVQILADDRTWRIREIGELKTAIKRADPILRKVLLRGLITLCYAHWEGYVKAAASKYMEHITLKKLRFDQLDRQFTRNRFLPPLAAMNAKKGSFTERSLLIDEILDSNDKQFKRVHSDLINTQSNLNFKIFESICLVCGISSASFLEHETFIDLLLLKRRNSIAHGEDIMIDMSDLESVTTKTIELMRMFGDLLENHIVQDKFRSSSTTNP
ncbi:hypothetical protein JIN84_00720 [Luteolibacter yonseiensis]|uniref:RiboL-PSP-HEPN domain-containing protein n=1 Tax=Luteolibacter yonseiensis TaxID=1144680 RepID=A0A934V9F9_9BACT|nr:MAE_28990/MAE_18760 family HEPN-like nuclease [Luteolibacter yonseiensis]MBK1814130.1 hypothetical protein [Luteolibacter yonseiensis]